MVLWWGAVFSVPENFFCGSGEPLKRVPQKRSGELGFGSGEPPRTIQEKPSSTILFRIALLFFLLSVSPSLSLTLFLDAQLGGDLSL